MINDWKTTVVTVTHKISRTDQTSLINAWNEKRVTVLYVFINTQQQYADYCANITLQTSRLALLMPDTCGATYQWL